MVVFPPSQIDTETRCAFSAEKTAVTAVLAVEQHASLLALPAWRTCGTAPAQHTQVGFQITTKRLLTHNTVIFKTQQ